MAQPEKTIYVYENWRSDVPTLIGKLRASFVRGQESFSFEYDDQWLNSFESSYPLDPDLSLYRGRQYTPLDKSLFGLFADSSPDRWGRMLMKRNHFKTARCTFVIVAVIAVVDGNKADIHERKGAFQIVSRFDVVTRKTGKILDDDQIDLASTDFLHHSRELRTVEVRTGITVICELKSRIFGQDRMLVEIAVYKHNVLYNDKKFATLLYQWHNDAFTEYSKVSDAGAFVKNNIYDFVDDSEKTVLVVDCENSDPYKLCATLKNLDYDVMQKISSVILFDDVHTATAWRILESYTKLPVEHIMIERIKQNKSLVDIKLTARACQEHYKNDVDSFVIVSSDSDYWGLISSLPDAHFLVMIEREKCGPDMKEALADSGIFYCYLDDFYSGNSEDIKKNALFKEMYRWIDNSVHLNVNDMFDAALRNTRIDMSPAERRQFYEKHIKHMTLQIDEDGNVGIELKRG